MAIQKFAGKNSKDDLKITAINTGGRTGKEVIINGAPGSIDNDANIANMAFTMVITQILKQPLKMPTSLP